MKKKFYPGGNMHRGKVIAQKGRYKILECEICKFKHVIPLPAEKEIERFYRKKYFKSITKGNRACEINRLMKKDKDSRKELKWLNNVLYADINIILKKYNRSGGSVLDIGCGTGDFLRYMVRYGWDAKGIEPSGDVRQKKKKNVTIYSTSLENFVKKRSEYKHKFNAITLLNVLEHVPNPINFLKQAKMLLTPQRGMICIRVPNDFNALQKDAGEKFKKRLWWVITPDHLNYFNSQSLTRLLRSLGFRLTYLTADFPMEFFLYMGDNYAVDSEVGRLCHQKRVHFELTMPEDLRREIYHNLATYGLGRNLLVFAKVE